MALVAHVQRLVNSLGWGFLPQVGAVAYYKQVTGGAIGQSDKVKTMVGVSACTPVDSFISPPYENVGGQRVQRAVSDLAAGEVTRTHAPQGHNHERPLTGPLPLEQSGRVRLPHGLIVANCGFFRIFVPIFARSFTHFMGTDFVSAPYRNSGPR